MIITAGKYKGRKIKTLKFGKIRPTSSKVRESIFNITQLTEKNTVFYEGETRFLDLFAGSGIMGLEALSRGAQKVIFVEKSFEVIKILKQNLSIVEEPEKIQLITGDSLKTLDNFRENKFNFIFIDPPYVSGLYEPVLKKIRKNELLEKNGIIILEHDCRTKTSNLAAECGFNLYRTKIYGDTGITILTV